MRDRTCIIPCSSKAHLPMSRLSGSNCTSIRTQPSLPLMSCSDKTQSNHEQQCGFFWWGEKYQWRGANDSSWILLDRWNHCHPQLHDWLYILHIYQGFELWMYLDAVPFLHLFHHPTNIREILGLEGRTVILSASFYGWNMTDITRNRLVIHVYSSLVRSSDLKIANQNNNLFTTIIIDDPTTDYYRSVEDNCISMITRFDRLILVFKDLSDLNITSFVRVIQRIVMISQETPTTGSVTSLGHK